MTATSTYVFRPYKAWWVLSLCIFVLCCLVFFISAVLLFRYGLWDMFLALGIIFILLFCYLFVAYKAHKIQVTFNLSGFEICDDHTRSYKNNWSDYKGVYLARSFYSHQYVLILRDEHTLQERRKICNRLDWRLNPTTVVDEGFAVWLPFQEGAKLEGIVPFSDKMDW